MTIKINHELTVVFRNPRELTANPHNHRTHPESQRKVLHSALEEEGWIDPVIYNVRTGRIVDGHARIEEAIAQGVPEVPVIEIDVDEATERKTIARHDRIGEMAGLDLDILRANLADLEEIGVGLDGLGWGDLPAFEPVNAGNIDNDAVPEPPVVSGTKPGDLWRLGEHSLLCGDATDPNAYARLLDGGQADMIFTDPPYNVAYEGKAGSIANDNLGAGFRVFLDKSLACMMGRCRGAVYICMSTSELDTLQAAFRTGGGHLSTLIIWTKQHFTLGRSDYHRQYEPILYGWSNGARRHWCGDRSQSDVWAIDRPVVSALHPTMKPVALVERALRNSSRPGDAVLDPFGGSGTTLIAAEKSFRRARLIEIEPRFVDVIVRRWEEWTGNKAVRAD